MSGRSEAENREPGWGRCRSALDGLFAPRTALTDPLWPLRGHLPLEGGEGAGAHPSLPIMPWTNQFMPRMSVSDSTEPAAALTVPS